jgi:hypothetical protein
LVQLNNRFERVDCPLGQERSSQRILNSQQCAKSELPKRTLSVTARWPITDNASRCDTHGQTSKTDSTACGCGEGVWGHSPNNSSRTRHLANGITRKDWAGPDIH